jgi:glutaredoxin 2
MNIYSVNPNISSEALSVKSTAKAPTDANYTGPSFAQSISEVARSANLQVAEGATNSALQFNRRKEEAADKPFDREQAEEEILEQYLTRIQKMLKELQK